MVRILMKEYNKSTQIRCILQFLNVTSDVQNHGFIEGAELSGVVKVAIQLENGRFECKQHNCVYLQDLVLKFASPFVSAVCSLKLLFCSYLL